jgi:hypothetical protein
MFDVTNIAGQILAQGLAGQIANAINVVGVPPIDRPEQVYTNSIVLALGGTFTSPVIDASEFNSLTVSVDEVNGAAGSCAVARMMYVWTWADAAGAIFMSGEAYSYMPSSGWVLVTPNMLKGPYVQVQFEALAAGAANATIDISLVGSYRTTGSQARVELGNSMAGGGMTLARATGDLGDWIAEGNWAIGAVEEYPCVYGGPATFGWNVGALTNQSYIYMYEVYSGGTLWALTLPVLAATQRGSMSIIMPVHAVRFRFTNSTGGAVACRFGITMDGNR